ncbi:isoleucine--tRNA ligase-like [Ylistrum balloti]|uniref:isoleucine--tRNA ligase-like n=1 Tax=Ylistrum balloti TaxID=509963 RepID=UPI002905D454|nr:isoleucine--tRNA ligase-like [Ylistrum balloti]
MFEEVDLHGNFPEMEKKILAFWKEKKIFQKSIEKNAGREEFVFYDGPPFATGLPHFGHFVPGTVKDIIPRYQTMKGKCVQRRFGWDCHGLPVEYEVEKEIGVSGKKDIEVFGIAAFNERCRNIVLRYTSEWRKIIERLGRWVDFDNDYKTMDKHYMESIWWVFKTLWEKGYIYKGHYILPYSPTLSTPLSNFEVNLGGYQEVHDPSLTVKFKIADTHNEFFLAWTTTPWTLISNQGLALGEDIDYVKVKDADECYILAEQRLTHYYSSESEYQIVKRYKGKDLEGMKYVPLYDYFKNQEKQGAFRVHVADFVSLEDGTGIVHMAGGFGEDDYIVLCKKAGIPVACPVDSECKFTSEIPEYEGVFVRDANSDIIKELKKQKKIIRHEQYLHRYPFCYRTKTPLIYRAVSSWFVDIAKIKEKMEAANSTINWHPEHLKYGRFGKWLENAQEWAISRNRYWGNPLPVWMNEDESCVEVIGSIEELEKKSGSKVDDLHKDKIDHLTWETPNKKGIMRRVPEVLDCWFESGAMPYAYNHYPFENKANFEKNFPADFVSEGLDQTRGWFYTLTVLASALFDTAAFNNVIVNGLVLAEDGKKMSKSERNFTDPVKVIDAFGADALRLFLINSSVLKAEDLRYSDDSVKEEIKRFILPLWSAYSFFITYARIDNVRPRNLDLIEPENPLDQWVLSELSYLVEHVDTYLGTYEILSALQEMYEFVDKLNNWSRDSQSSSVKNRQPLSTLHIATKDKEEEDALREMEGILKEELNVKQVLVSQNEEHLVTYTIKANFKVLGSTLGAKMKQASQFISSLNVDQIVRLLEGKTLIVEVEGQEIELNKDSVVINRKEKDNLKVLNDGTMTVALDPNISTELLQEGIVRDIVPCASNQNIEESSEEDSGDAVAVVSDVQEFTEYPYYSGFTLFSAIRDSFMIEKILSPLLPQGIARTILLPRVRFIKINILQDKFVFFVGLESDSLKQSILDFGILEQVNEQLFSLRDSSIESVLFDMQYHATIGITNIHYENYKRLRFDWVPDEFLSSFITEENNFWIWSTSFDFVDEFSFEDRYLAEWGFVSSQGYDENKHAISSIVLPYSGKKRDVTFFKMLLPNMFSFLEVEQDSDLSETLPHVRTVDARIVIEAIPVPLVLIENYITPKEGQKQCFDVMKGACKKFHTQNSEFKIPHIGWNELEIQTEQCPLFTHIENKTPMYFVHSFYLQPDEEAVILAKTEYIQNFASVIGKGSAIGLQFHPEKSGKAGLRILDNFLRYY